MPKNFEKLFGERSKSREKIVNLMDLFRCNFLFCKTMSYWKIRFSLNCLISSIFLGKYIRKCLLKITEWEDRPFFIFELNMINRKRNESSLFIGTEIAEY